jgi:hypothetical protein
MATSGKPALRGLPNVTAARYRRGIALLLLVAACAAEPDGAAEDAAPAATAIDRRTVVLLTASAAALDSLRDRIGEEAFYVVADDMMWYRAQAWEYFEVRGIPVRTIEGRPVLEFVVDDAPRRFTFFEHPTLDLLVLYDPGREPLVVAPIDVDTARWFFGD